jgi:hypothetical protein
VFSWTYKDLKGINTYLNNLGLYKSPNMPKQNLQCYFLKIFQFINDLVATRIWLLIMRKL